MKGIKLMYSHKRKIVGVIISAAGVLGMVGERIHPFILNKKWDADQHYGLFLWITLFGLVIIAYCKEKYDDERAQQIRLKAFQLSFMIMISVMMAMAMIKSVVRPPDFEIDGQVIFTFAALGIVGYLLTFYTGLYFDRFWDFEDKNISVWENIKAIPKNIGGILIYLLVFTITLFLIMLIGS